LTHQLLIYQLFSVRKNWWEVWRMRWY